MPLMPMLEMDSKQPHPASGVTRAPTSQSAATAAVFRPNCGGTEAIEARAGKTALE